MQKSTGGGWEVEPGKRRYRIKLLPGPKDPYLLNLAPQQTRNTLIFSVKASRDSKDLLVSFGGNANSQEFGPEGLTEKTEDGAPTRYQVIDFGVYDAKKEFEFETPIKGKTLILERSNDGDLTVWIKGEDLSKAEKTVNPDKGLSYVTTYTSEGRVVGHRIKDFVHACNSYFYVIMFGLEF